MNKDALTQRLQQLFNEADVPYIQLLQRMGCKVIRFYR